jgi:hypothetical protein
MGSQGHRPHSRPTTATGLPQCPRSAITSDDIFEAARQAEDIVPTEVLHPAQRPDHSWAIQKVAPCEVPELSNGFAHFVTSALPG